VNEKKIVQMPQAQEPMPNAQPSELEIRRQNELAMLEHTARKKQMQSQMKPKIDA
jgi:hypothetical protein